MIRWSKISGLRPMSTSALAITLKPQWYINITWIIGGIGSVLIPISTSPITINTFYVIVKGRVADPLRPTSASCAITPTIFSFIYSYNQQSTMDTWVMGLIVAGLGHISTSPITTNSFSCIAGLKVAGLFIPISTSTRINSYIPPLDVIITTSISPPIIIIITDTTLIFFVNIFLYITRIN